MRYLCCAYACFLDTPTGSARVAWDIAGLMRDRGHEVTLACFARRDRVGEGGEGGDEGGMGVSMEQGIRVLRTPLPRSGGASSLNPLPRFIRAMAQALARDAEQHGGWDVVHPHLAYLETAARRALGKAPKAASGQLPGAGAGPRYVFTLHSPIVEEQLVRWRYQGLRGRLKKLLGVGYLKRLEADAFGRSDAVHVLSEFSRREIQRFHGHTERVTVVPHWCRADLYRTHTKAQARVELGWPADRPVLFTLRRHAHRMGLDVAIEAVSPIAREGRCFFAIGGDGELREQLKAQAKRLGALGPEMIRFLGRIPDEELNLAYQAADLFLLPTRELECFGLITQEAMAFGCPVLGTDAGATPELIQPIAPELIVPAGDAQALGSRLERFLAGELDMPDPEAIQRYTHERFGREAIEPRLASLIQGDAEPPAGG